MASQLARADPVHRSDRRQRHRPHSRGISRDRQRPDIIAYGRVIETTVQWSDDRKHVDTLVTMQVGTYLKGARGESSSSKFLAEQSGRYIERDRRRRTSPKATKPSSS